MIDPTSFVCCTNQCELRFFFLEDRANGQPAQVESREICCENNFDMILCAAWRRTLHQFSEVCLQGHQSVWTAGNIPAVGVSVCKFASESIFAS